MQRITAVNPAEATGKAKQLLDGVQAKLGMTPNLMRTLAAGPAALEAYLNFGAALGTGHLDAKFREQIALGCGASQLLRILPVGPFRHRQDGWLDTGRERPKP